MRKKTWRKINIVTVGVKNLIRCLKYMGKCVFEAIFANFEGLFVKFHVQCLFSVHGQNVNCFYIHVLLSNVIETTSGVGKPRMVVAAINWKWDVHNKITCHFKCSNNFNEKCCCEINCPSIKFFCVREVFFYEITSS